MSKGDLSWYIRVFFGGLGDWVVYYAEKKYPPPMTPFIKVKGSLEVHPSKNPWKKKIHLKIRGFSGGKVVQDLIFFVHEHSLCSWFQAECFMLFITGSGETGKHNKQQQRQATTTAATATSANEVLGFVNLWIVDSVFHFYNNRTSFYLLHGGGANSRGHQSVS